MGTYIALTKDDSKNLINLNPYKRIRDLYCFQEYWSIAKRTKSPYLYFSYKLYPANVELIVETINSLWKNIKIIIEDVKYISYDNNLIGAKPVFYVEHPFMGEKELKKATIANYLVQALLRTLSLDEYDLLTVESIREVGKINNSEELLKVLCHYIVLQSNKVRNFVRSDDPLKFIKAIDNIDNYKFAVKSKSTLQTILLNVLLEPYKYFKYIKWNNLYLRYKPQSTAYLHVFYSIFNDYKIDCWNPSLTFSTRKSMCFMDLNYADKAPKAEGVEILPIRKE